MERLLKYFLFCCSAELQTLLMNQLTVKVLLKSICLSGCEHIFNSGLFWE
jgi:hypothetical protein